MAYELAIIGGGPAGVGAGVYAARKNIKTIFLTGDFGGQSTVSADIQNWIGTISIAGSTFGKSLKDHLYAYQGEWLDIRERSHVIAIEESGSLFKIKTEAGEEFETQTILITAGASRKKLLVPGADRFEHRGITYCASCDGPFFAGREVAVIGGGNAGFEAALQLLAYAKSVTLLTHGPEFRADAITVEKILKNPKMRAIRNAEPVEVKGGDNLEALMYKDTETGEVKELKTEGIFVEIGMVPNTDFAASLIDLTPHGSIKVDPKTQRTSRLGLWAAGDCTDGLYHQNNIAVGDAVKALEDIYLYLKRGK